MTMREMPKEHLNVMESSPETLGEWLASARRARGLEQREVAHRISMDIKTLQSIENNEFDSLGAPVFVRSYLTRYARLLNLPEAQILEQYRQLGLDNPPPLRLGQSIQPQASMGSSGFRWVTYLGLLGLLAYGGWVGVQELSSRFVAADDQDPMPITRTDADGSATLALPQAPPARDAAAPMPARPLIRPEQAFQQPPQGEAISPDPDPGPVAAVAPEPTPPLSPRPQAPVSVAAETPVQSEDLGVTPPENSVPKPDATTVSTRTPPAAPEESRLVMEFAEDCWVDIKDARGNRLLYGVMKAKAVRNLSGVPPFSLVMGNAVAVRLTLDGQAVDRSNYVPRQGTVSRVKLGKPGG